MKIIKVIAFVLGAGLLMGNQQCQEVKNVDQPKPRMLKKIVEVGLVSSRLIDLPGGGRFDFQFVLNQQIYPVLQKSDKFWFRYDPIFRDSMLPDKQIDKQNLDLNKMNLSKLDYEYLRNSLTSNPPKVVFSDDISCFVNLPQLEISGSVNSFEMVSSIGLGIGFTQLGSISSVGIPKIGFKVQNFQLDMNLNATPPLEKTSLAAVNVTSKQTKTEVNFFLPFQNLLFEPSFFFQTPLAKVSYNALEKALAGINDQLVKSEVENKSNLWTTRVLFDHEEGITILAGTNHNIQVGDTFDIYNEKAYWISENGEIPVPCNSRLQGTIPGEKVAVIEIDYVGEDLSRGKVIYETGIPRKMGALVKVNKLKAPL